MLKSFAISLLPAHRFSGYVSLALLMLEASYDYFTSFPAFFVPLKYLCSYLTHMRYKVTQRS